MIYKHTKKHVPSILFLIISSLFLFIGMGIGIWYYRQEFRNHDYLITDHLDMLERIFNDIEATSHILGLDRERNYINFLTVKSFVGSEIGGMNLEYPEKWAGPYLMDNPTIQGKEYVLLKTGNGYFIIPDDGVRLGNGQIIGKDIVFNAATDLNQFFENPQLFLSSKKPMIRKIRGQKQATTGLPPITDSLAE